MPDDTQGRGIIPFVQNLAKTPDITAYDIHSAGREHIPLATGSLFLALLQYKARTYQKPATLNQKNLPEPRQSEQMAKEGRPRQCCQFRQQIHLNVASSGNKFT